MLGASAGHPNCGNYIYIFDFQKSVMGRAGYINNTDRGIDDNKASGAMQRELVITATPNKLGFNSINSKL